MDSIWKGQRTTSRSRQSELRLWELLTGNGAQVEVVPDHLLELVVQGALLKLQAEVVMQICIQHLTWRGGERNLHETKSPTQML